MWRLTHDWRYRTWGWEVFQAFERHCKVGGPLAVGYFSVGSTWACYAWGGQVLHWELFQAFERHCKVSSCLQASGDLRPPCYAMRPLLLSAPKAWIMRTPTPTPIPLTGGAQVEAGDAG